MMTEEGSNVTELFDGVFSVPDPRNPGKKILATENLTPGRSVYGETLVRYKFRGELKEFRSWDPFRSKLSAAILNKLKDFPFTSGTYCVYLGASTGTTVSHLSDVVGNSGRIFAVEVAARVAREMLENLKSRRNVLPIVEDAKHPEKYPAIYGRVTVIYADIAQPDQTEIAIQNCDMFLEKEGFLFLVVKASSIDVSKSKKEVFRDQVSILETNSGFNILELIDLEPYDRNHAMIVARKIG